MESLSQFNVSKSVIDAGAESAYSCWVADASLEPHLND